MSGYYWRGGEKAELTDKNDGNEHQSGFSKYKVVIQFDGNEYHCRCEVQRRDFCFRALSLRELKDQVRRCFPDVRFVYSLSRAAELAVNPGAATILQGQGR